MFKLWKWYQNCLSVHPLKTQIISSGALWGVADIAAQYVTHQTHKHLHILDADKCFAINWKRTAITSIFGIGFVGPVGHFWYEGLDRFIQQKLRLEPKTRRFVAAKVAVDGIVFGPFDLLVFLSYMGFASGKKIAEVKEDVRRDFLPALILEGSFWPILQVVNFRYVPVKYQLLYANTFCLLDSTFLSWLEQQKDAAWKQWFVYSPPSLKEESED
ncbi:hypothetical protein KSS87_019116 [Heliosperma pusillum]|nr:hypothetical protein KSS87_011751 [Heliosperma pusillum]KAH9624047.1 hypothetical protein KSS87_019116 [Heliosperma pusillum]